MPLTPNDTTLPLLMYGMTLGEQAPDRENLGILYFLLPIKN